MGWRKKPTMKWLQGVVAVILIVIGLLWIGQGTNLVGGSQMSGNSGWAVAGVLFTAAGVGLLYWLTRRRSARHPQ